MIELAMAWETKRDRKKSNKMDRELEIELLVDL